MLKFIGTGSAFNSKLGNTSAYYKENGNLLLIDCGETVFGRILDLNLLEDVNNVYIAITHTHGDHIGSLGSLVLYLNIMKGIVPNIIITAEETAEAQENTIKNFLTITGVSEEEFEFTYADMMEEVFVGLETINMKQITHSSKLTSYAVELIFKDKAIYYVGDNNDAKYIKSIVKKLNKNDIIYTDATNREYKNSVHISLNKLSEIVPEEKRKQVNCMHFDSYATISDAKDFGFNVVTNEISKEELLRHIAGRK